VVFFTHRHPIGDGDRATLAARDIGVVDGPVERLVVSDDRLQGIELADGRVVPRAALFVRPSLHARAGELLEGLGCELAPDGLVRTDATGRTTVPGVWAAGNAANARAQVVTAAGEGSAAAIAINTELVADDVARAIPHTDAPVA
jgi:thioredoxin reductase